MTGRMKTEPDPVDIQGDSKIMDLYLVKTTQPVPDNGRREGGTEVMTVAGNSMIAVSMGDQCPVDRLVRIDVDICAGTIDSFRCKTEQRVAVHELNNWFSLFVLPLCDLN